jgi:hypothetical protein
MPARGTATVVGEVRYRSKFEAAVAADLRNRGVKFEYEGERIFYAIPATYVTDFTIPATESITGEPIYVETKGYLDPPSKRKLIAVRNDNPGMDLRLLLQKGKRKRSGKLTKEAEWCNRNNFKWAEGRVPDAWLKEKE